MKNCCAFNWGNPLSIFFFALLFAMASCSDEQKEQPTKDLTEEVNAPSDSIGADESTNGVATSEKSLTQEDTLFTAASTSKYNGEWFTIDYPTSFTAQPDGPIEKQEEYTYIITDEARFTSPDGKVEFFVYSPLWSGEPKDYIEVADNEELVSDKTTPEEVAPENVHRWVSVKAKDGSYQRAFYSKKTMSTHKVFGIKYTDQEAYDKYKAAYTDFKDSLLQYSD